MRRAAVLVGCRAPAGDGAIGLAPVLPGSDRAAVALALRRFGGGVDAYCLGDDEEAMRYALAAGAASAERLGGLEAIDFDVLLVGSGGAGPWGDWLPARLAEHKQCALVLEVLDVEPGAGGLTVTRDLGRGDREQLLLSGPAVLSVSEEAPRLEYVSRHRRRAVSLPAPAAATAAMADPLRGASGPWEPVRPRARMAPGEDRMKGTASARMQALLGLSDSEGDSSDRQHVIRADAATCASHLLRYLGHHGFLDPAAGGERPASGAVREAGRRDPSLPEPARRPEPLTPSKARSPDAARGERRRRGPQPLEGGSRRPQRRPRSIEDESET